MEVSTLTEDVVKAFIDELWLPAQRQMAAAKEYSLADGIREKGIAYRRSQLSDPDAITYIANRDGAWIGYVAAEIQTPPPIVEQVKECHINELFVKESARREGVASTLLASVESWARDQDCESMTLMVNSDNHPAIELYESTGYTIPRHKMKKPLDR